MKYRYVIRTYVDAGSPQEALKIAAKTKPHEVYLDDRVFEKNGFAITQEQTKSFGLTDKK